MKIFDLRDLQVFLEAAESGGITRAAARLNTTQSSLSRRLINLERELGTPLFTRDARGVQLTPAGARLKRMAAPLLQRAHDIWNAVALDGGSPSDLLNIGMVPGVSKVVQDAVKALRTERRDVTVSLKEAPSEHLQGLVASNKLDLIIATNPQIGKGLILTPLWRERIYIAAPKPRSNKDGKLALKDLADLPFIQASRSPGLRETVKEAFEREGIKFSVAYEIESVATIRRMIAAGEAFSVMAYPTLANQVEADAILTRPLPHAFIERTLVQKRAKVRSRAHNSFVNFLRQQADMTARTHHWALPVRLHKRSRE